MTVYTTDRNTYCTSIIDFFMSVPVVMVGTMVLVASFFFFFGRFVGRIDLVL